MFFNNCKIVLPNSIIENGFIEVKDGLIASLGEGKRNDKDSIDLNGNIVMPGFIDMHTHGALGIDFMDASVEDIKKVGAYFYSEGITTFLLTTLTSSHEDLMRVSENVSKAMELVPSLGGIHFEGPFISAKYKGAQNEAFIRAATVNEMKQLIEASSDNVRLITLAPEKEGSLETTKFLSSNGVTVSMGHSNATFDEALAGFEAGATNLTHSHNAMSGYNHREPGLLEAGMYYDRAYCELISDKIHVCPNTIKAFYKIVGPDRFMIITDSLSAKGSSSDHFTLMGLPCVKKNGAAYLEEGPLAGSLLPFDQGVRNIFDIVKPSLIDLAKVSSSNQAKSLHLNDRGTIEVGKLADFVVLDEKLNLISTYKKGEKVYGV